MSQEPTARGEKQAVVVIPAYNAANTIARTLESVFAQTWRDFEVVVVNDGSTDDTAAVLAPYAQRVRIIAQPNRGFCTSRNVAIRSSHAGLVALLDSDDVWMPDKLAKSVAWLNRNPEAVLVYSDVTNVDPKGRELGTSPVDPPRAHAPTHEEMLSFLWPIMPSTVVMRRAAFEAAGAFVDGVSEDLDFWIRIREQGPFGYLPEKLTRFTFGEFYPKVLNRDVKGQVFFRVMRNRYGARAEGVIRSFIRHKVRILSNVAMIELARGNRSGARRCLLRALRYDPMRFKAYSRLLRTMLPMSVIRMLSGNAMRARIDSRGPGSRAEGPR